MREMLRDYLKLAADAAAGAAGEFRRRAESGARELVELSGLDPEQLRAKVPASVQSLAEEIVGAGRTNSELLIGLVRSEAEKAWSRLGDGMVQVGVVLELLERQVRALQGGEEDAAPSAAEPEPEPGSKPEAKPESRAEQAFPGRVQRPAPRSTPRPVRVVVDPDDGAASAAAAAAARRRAAVPGMRKVAASRGTAATTSPAEVTEPTPAPARKTAAKKTAAKKAAPEMAAPKKTVAKKAATKQAPAQQAPAKTAAAKKPAAKKPAAKQAVAKKATAKKATAKKSTAGTQTAARKAPARKPRQSQESVGDE